MYYMGRVFRLWLYRYSRYYIYAHICDVCPHITLLYTRGPLLSNFSLLLLPLICFSLASFFAFAFVIFLLSSLPGAFLSLSMIDLEPTCQNCLHI